MASTDSLELKDAKQKLVRRKSSTTTATKKNWFDCLFPFLKRASEDLTEKHVKRRLLFEKSGVDGDGKKVLSAEDFLTAEENINDVVDQDESDLENIISNRLVPDFLCSTSFRVAVYLSIVLNAIILGLETVDWFREDYSILTQVIKELTLAFFVCEILLKWYCGFWIFWQSNWNIVDFVIVGLAVIGPEFRFVSCGRILRLLRACFMLRTIASFDKFRILKGLATIIDSLLLSLPDMVNICLLLLLILLVLAIAAKNLLGEEIHEYYGDLGAAFFSLFILTTQDGLIIQYKKFEPKSIWIRSIGAIFYFIATMAGAFIFVNIIVAISCYNLEVACVAAEGGEEHDDADEKGAADRDLTEESSDDPAAEFLEKLQFISRNKAHKGINLGQLQKPFQLTDFSNLTVAKLEKYLMVLSALEENFAEYEDIKNDLEELYELVKNLNLLDVIQGNESSSTLNMDTPTMGKASIGSGTKGGKGSDNDMRQLMDMLKRSSMRNQPIPVKRTTEDMTHHRSSASSDGSQSRKRLSPSDALHQAGTSKQP